MEQKTNNYASNYCTRLMQLVDDAKNVIQDFCQDDEYDCREQNIGVCYESCGMMEDYVANGYVCKFDKVGLSVSNNDNDINQSETEDDWEYIYWNDILNYSAICDIADVIARGNRVFKLAEDHE